MPVHSANNNCLSPCFVTEVYVVDPEPVLGFRKTRAKKAIFSKSAVESFMRNVLTLYPLKYMLLLMHLRFSILLVHFSQYAY